MSKWTEIRDEIVKTLNIDHLDEKAKQQITRAIVENVLPTIKDAVDRFVAKIKEQATSESGWTRLRDGIVLPLLVTGLFALVETTLKKTLDAQVAG